MFLSIQQHVVQAGVNSFPAGAGFAPAASIGAADGGIPVALAVKNDPIPNTLKQDNVVTIPSIPISQVKLFTTQFSRHI